MILEIDDRKTIGDLKERFQECFPLLKIEFYENHHWKPSSRPLPSNSRVEAIRSHHDPGLLEIKSTSRVHTIRKEFQKSFDLYVQIFRMHERGWVPTDMNEDLTLREQSELAMLSQQKNETILYNKDEDEIM